MSSSQESQVPNLPNPELQTQQDIHGDRNQSIGQVLGGMVVYVSGGQAIFGATSGQAEESAQKKAGAAIGENPYKGLLAFQETDGDRFLAEKHRLLICGRNCALYMNLLMQFVYYQFMGLLVRENPPWPGRG